MTTRGETTGEPTVGNFMTAMPATVDEGLLLLDAQERMFIDNIRHLVVCRGRVVVGVLSTRDVSNALARAGEHPERLTVADAMSPDPWVCPSTTPLSEVALAMEANRYGCVVVHDGNHLAGVFTTIDALRALRTVVSRRGARRPAERQITPHHLPPTDLELDGEADAHPRYHLGTFARLRERRARRASHFRAPRSTLWRAS